MPRATALRTRLLLLPVLVAVLAVSGCKTRGDELQVKGSPENIQSTASDDIRRGNYPSAIQKLEQLEARYPFSAPAKQGQLDLMYAYYKNRDAESAIDQASQFIRENPTHPRVDYAYYIQGLVYFESGASEIERFFGVNIAKRPPQEALKSFQSFQSLLQRYPRSPYAADARQRMVYLRNRLADYEVAVARYYMKRGAYVGAANRARNVIETYDGAPAVEDALRIMASAYRKLGMGDLASVADSVRSANRMPDVVGGVAVPATATAGLATSPETVGQGGPHAASRAGRWEARLGLTSSNSTDVEFEGDTTADIDGSTGFALGIAWHYTDHLQFGSTLTYDQKDYTVEIAGADPGDSFTSKGGLDTTTLMVDAAYNLLSGPLTPFVAAGIGWSWVDTNVASGPPEIGCWWHPWWGYVCTGWQDTRTVDGLAYELGLGLRYDLGGPFVVDGSYRMRWIDFENATGNPAFDGFQLNLGWKF